MLRTARPALEAALATPGTEMPVTQTPPPTAYFRVEVDLLWVRVLLYEQGRRQLNERQIAAIWAGTFGTAHLAMDVPPDGGSWDSIYLVGPCPSPDDYSPPLRLDRP